MGWARTVLALIAVAAAGALLVSGGSGTDPETPSGLPGMAPPFLGVAVLGDGGLTAAVDSYGDMVDLRAPGPAGRALIDNPAGRQAAGTVAADTGIQVRVQVGDEELPLWRADSVRQRYLPGTSVLQTVARFGGNPVRLLAAAHGHKLAIVAAGPNASRVRLRVPGAGEVVSTLFLLGGRTKMETMQARPGKSASFIARAAAADRRWLRQARPLGADAPTWARRMYRRSLLVLRALTDRRTGAVAAGARDGWDYVWPRDAAAVAIAYAAAGYRGQAAKTARFLLGLDLEAAARFHGDGTAVPGRDAQGDAIGWVAAAARASGIADKPSQAAGDLGGDSIPWRDRADYQEGDPGDYLGNALASHADVSELDRHIWGESSDTPPVGLVREAGEPGSGLDSAAAWGVRPFPHPDLFPAIRRTLLALTAAGGRYGITPGEGWSGGEDPWSAPTAWTAWSLAALGERREALRLMQALRRSATSTGDLPERVDAQTGVPRSTTPLAWSHAFAILALRELWPQR